MQWIRTFREKQQTSRQTSIQLQAEQEITLSDYDSKIYISYSGVPMIPIEESWTTKEILEKLGEVRTSYINYKMKEVMHPRAAMF